MANRSRIVVVGAVIIGSALATGASMIGCGGDDNIVPGVDAAPDKTTVDTGTDVVTPPDASDGGVNDSGPDVTPDTGNPILAFMDAQATNTCLRYGQCCFGNDASAFDMAKCKDTVKNGVENNVQVLVNNPSLITGGRVVVDQTAATKCLAESLTFSCPTAQATEYATNTSDCYAALKGTQANGQPCNDTIECATGFCKVTADGGTDAGVGTCTALVGNGGPCSIKNVECQYRGFVGPTSRCDIQDGGTNTCANAKLANGATCTYAWECQSGVCDFATKKCQPTIVTVNPGICTFFTIKDAGGGG